LPGHCVALLHNLTKFYFTNYPAGFGHKYLHLIPFTSIYSNGLAFPFPLEQRTNIDLSTSLLW
jgi:hypothetical protein